MAVPQTPDTLTGTVTSVNPKGLKLDGGADWLNFSKYAKNLVPPMRGATIAVTLDGQGYIRALELVSAPQDATSSRQAPVGQRDTVITRLAVLKAASEFAASRPQLKSGDVVKIAQRWESWVNRPADDLGLTDAF